MRQFAIPKGIFSYKSLASCKDYAGKLFFGLSSCY
jgi:hypothetical protein